MDSQNGPTLRKARPFYGRVKDITSTRLLNTGPPKLRRLLKIDFKDPKDDYTFLQELRSNQGTLVCHRRDRLHLAIIRESYTPAPLKMLDLLAKFQHHNIADIIDVFFHDDKLCIVGEYLGLSLLDLEFQKLAPEEWEIATIVAEVIKAMTYLLDTLPACELHIDGVRLSLQGDVKLVPDVYYERSQKECAANHQYYSAFLVSILEVLMEHGTPSDKGWSREALEFSIIPSTDSLMPFMNHAFLSKAVSSSRLVPRVRLATQMLGCQPHVHLKLACWGENKTVQDM